MSLHSNNAPANASMSVRKLMSIWMGFAAALVLAPLVFSSSTAVSLLSQIGTAMIFGLSYNMLLGQGGMLSFGHAAFFGLGSFTAVHFMNLAAGGAVWLPLPFIPLVGGVAGLLFAALVGYVITQKSGTTFAMITLGIGQMVFACALMFPAFFGGEGGVSTNRVYGEKFFGLSFGSQLEVYFLIAFWLLLCTASIYAFTRTPLGRIVNAVRDNAERTAFIGYEPRLVRYFSLIASAGFAGIAGALNAINFEIASAENLSLVRSGDVLLFTFIGGVSVFIGPMVGAVVGVLMTVLLSDYTQAWHMYLGTLFVLVVVYAPEGITSLLQPAQRLLRDGLKPTLLPRTLLTGAMTLLTLVGAVIVIELLYHRSSGSTEPLSLFGVVFDHQSTTVWLVALVMLVVGGLSLKRSARWMWEGIEDAVHSHDMNRERSLA